MATVDDEGFERRADWPLCLRCGYRTDPARICRTCRRCQECAETPPCDACGLCAGSCCRGHPCARCGGGPVRTAVMWGAPGVRRCAACEGALAAGRAIGVLGGAAPATSRAPAPPLPECLDR
jgi:hypothetical protein